MSEPLPLHQYKRFSALPWLTHGITTRHGGVSEGRMASLNTSFTVEDEVERVEENLRRIGDRLDVERDHLYWAYQVHGNAVTFVDGASPARPRCDILLTDKPDRALLLRYADCTPVLLVDPRTRTVGVVHAGWRGTALRAAGTAVRAMAERFGTRPRDVAAAVGPAIGPCCYEVGRDVEQAFEDRPWLLDRQPNGKAHLDLWSANRDSLVEAGVPAEQVEVAGLCTRCHADEFFSHRANEGELAGRFAAVIGIRR